MEETNNIFQMTLKIGAELGDNKITFNELFEKLKIKFQINKNDIPVIRRWFYDYFYTPNTYRIKSGISSSDLTDYDLKKHDNEKAYFTGDGYFKYYEYLEVKKAYENAEAATKQAKKALFWMKISLFVAISVGLHQILLMDF